MRSPRDPRRPANVCLAVANTLCVLGACAVFVACVAGWLPMWMWLTGGVLLVVSGVLQQVYRARASWNLTPATFLLRMLIVFALVLGVGFGFIGLVGLLVP